MNFNPRAYVRHDFVVVVVAFREENFNPRAYVRHDIEFLHGRIVDLISIHVPT